MLTRIGMLRPGYVRLYQVRLVHVCSSYVRLGHLRSVYVRLGNVRPCSGKFTLCQVTSGDCRFFYNILCQVMCV